MHYISAVVYETGYKLRLTFEDASVRIVDLEKYLEGEVFEPLKDIQHFMSARLDLDIDTVVWDNGADMSPDFLYEIATAVQGQNSDVLAVAEDRGRYGK